MGMSTGKQIYSTQGAPIATRLPPSFPSARRKVIFFTSSRVLIGKEQISFESMCTTTLPTVWFCSTGAVTLSGRVIS